MALFYLATNARIDYLCLSMARPAAETLQAWMRSTAQLAGCSHSQKVGKVHASLDQTDKLNQPSREDNIHFHSHSKLGRQILKCDQLQLVTISGNPASKRLYLRKCGGSARSKHGSHSGPTGSTSRRRGTPTSSMHFPRFLQ